MINSDASCKRLGIRAVLVRGSVTPSGAVKGTARYASGYLLCVSYVQEFLLPIVTLQFRPTSADPQGGPVSHAAAG